MGLLALGTPLEWPEAKKAAHQVRQWGIKQLLEIWNKAKGKERDAMLWGDEIEYLVVTFSKDEPKVRLSLRQAEILDALSKCPDLANGESVSDAKDKKVDRRDERDQHEPAAKRRRVHGDDLSSIPAAPPDKPGTLKPDHPKPVFHPEFGRFMLEATPGKPWGIDFKELLDVEPDMRLRRKIAKKHMRPDEFPITLTTFPRIGCPGDFTDPYYPPSGPRLRSQFVPDEIANPHIRFPTLAANIRWRRGRKVQVNVPVFHDKNTPTPWKDPTVNYDLHNWPEDDDVRTGGAAPDDFIHMDAMAFGMGSCCLQITFQAKNIIEGRRMYDQLSPLGPIMLALTAATPIYKGFLANTDVRWNQISRAVDCRTPEELGEKPLKNDRWRIPKSRYASNSTYISTDSRLRPEYLDPNLVVDEDIKAQLIQGGMDDRLATHFAHLFIRDPIVVFQEDLEELDLNKTDHFENLQSTNWQHMRFKPPPADNSIGWRVEFRPMEIQVTDFENAAFSVFMVLVTRVILSFDLNFYIPITKVDENMERAHAVDAVLNQRFYFRKNPFPGRHSHVNNGHANNAPSSSSSSSRPGSRPPSRPPTPVGPVEDEYTEMTVDDIINGCDNDTHTFPGLIPLVESYLDSVNVDVQTRCALDAYLRLISMRASGRLVTAARWIRGFVDAHPAYRHDSVVGEEVQKDLIAAVVAVGERELELEGEGEGKGKGFANMGVPGLGRLLGSFRGGCGDDET
ncbi:glutamate-cysteine ligase [Sodiomyces alkalinus F11]|uniref:Glutamate--cysteine ligase n=1 Tax=Sodiomyces alkalinus (strain CBS 110278 / VKM F-3762 / F11) TaxID=1314773 RepID=A0A3N2Q3X5_SODAK|nr:glutamate-cysteine ligase [Sodiomyces alkalinus F11]ROT41378.1 glutamate-cysteine ligase [Sodiomyces alkalinus F11]